MVGFKKCSTCTTVLQVLQPTTTTTTKCSTVLYYKEVPYLPFRNVVHVVQKGDL